MEMSEHTQDTQASKLVSPSAALQTEFVIPAAPEAGETTAAKDDSPVECLGFCIGNLGLLYPEIAGRELTEPSPTTPLPNTAPWLLGIANVRGNMVPVVDLSIAFGIERDQSQTRYLLIIGRADETMGLLVDGLPRPLSLEAREKLPSIPPPPELLEAHVKGAYDHAGAVWLDVDYDSFSLSLIAKVTVL